MTLLLQLMQWIKEHSINEQKKRPSLTKDINSTFEPLINRGRRFINRQVAWDFFVFACSPPLFKTPETAFGVSDWIHGHYQAIY